MSRRETLEDARATGLLVHLIRHGQSQNTHRPDGESSPPNAALTPSGVAEARLVAARLRPLGIDRLVSSPMRRTIETAAAVADTVDLPIEVWAGCYEYRAIPGFFCWGGRELRARYPGVALPADFGEDDWWYGDEPLDHAVSRAGAFLDWLRAEARRAEQRHLVVVTHGAFTRIVLARVFGADPRQMEGAVDLDNTSVTTLHVTADRVWVLSLNDTSHLAGCADLDPLRGLNR